jgi:hypothetical protein
MQFKKLAAITGSALMAGLSLAAPVLATSVTKLSDVGKLVSASGTTVSYPMFVIGATAATADVAGAVDVAVNLASNAVVTQQVATSTGAISVSGGVNMATASNPVVMWENLSSSKQTLTASDLPDLLASGTYVDANSISTPFSQYLGFPTNDGQVVYDTPNGGTAPSLGMKFAGSLTVYNYTLAFTKQISEAIGTSVTGKVDNLINTQLNMLGKTWTVTGATVNAAKDLALTLLSGKNSQTVTTETPATYTVGDKTYTVTLVAVGSISSTSVNAVTVTVSGGNLAAPETLQILSGGTKPMSDGTLIGVSSIFATTKTGAIDSATIFVGADKLELEDLDMTDSAYYTGVKINGNSLTDVGVSMSGNATSTTGTLTLNSLALAWTPSLEQFVSSGNSLTDPASGSFKILFGGITPALDDAANREMITVTPSGTTGGVAFKTMDGNNLNQNFIRTTATSTQTFADSGGYPIHVREGEAVAQNEYQILGQNILAGNSQNPFGHIIRVLSLQTSAASTSQLQDVASGTTIQITGGNTTLYLDGQAYQVCVPTTAAAYFVWGTGALCAGGVNPGSAVDVYPAIQTSKGAWVSITNPVTYTNTTANTTLNFPTGQLIVYPTLAGGLQTVGTAKYNIAQTATTITINATDNSAAAWSTPGVLVVEGVDASIVRNTIALRLIGGTTTTRVEIAAAPSFTGSKTASPGISGTTLQKFVDTYGSFVTYDQTAPGTFSLSYPTNQAQAIVAVGKSPSASAGGAGGTVTTQTVLPITADIVKLDSEVAEADKTANDLVLVGGPCVNTLVASLADAGKFPYTCANWPGRNFGRIQLISDAFATGKTALVIAGTRADDSDLAARIVQSGWPGISATQAAGSSVEVTGTVQSPAYA